MKKNILAVIFIISFCSLASFGETAKEILDKTKEMGKVDSVASLSEINIQKDGKTMSTLKIAQYSSKDKNGLQRTMIEFKAPANVRNTRFLIKERKDGTMDQRIFLPNLRKSRRISAQSAGSESFMGTDFSYDDISFMERDSSLDLLSILKEEKYDGKNCFVIQAIPKDKNFAYTKTLMWIAKKDYTFLKGEFYKNNKLIKVIKLSEYKKTNNIMTPYKTSISTVDAKTSTIVNIKKIVYKKIPEAFFTKKYLETGKR